ncbi:putative membrane protein YphA (DoxX/SURF4 family) [Chryseobacterium sp. H1D6B]|uniref:TQO small subunit DoxD n=1 Tax=Chryseobacterium sp. H1D6B TaxID=2940588 RepID=UPI0015C6CED8|nr:TQO small subunit DoxD [Chryseobacterium sp. H1D6B]MDH6250409.1 putative membrane protein YphA (DoxX/SURF4 family) [Chryseobacterium sp. H1D6B]
MKNNMTNQPFNRAGLFTLSIRLVIGWTYFSAFWRRLILENKLIPDEAGYIGEKFNHFLPNALGIKPIIEYLVTHPDALETSMITFTIIEAVVGLFIMLGLFTRLMSIGIFGLAMGILLGSGWIGTTCLDEWQIGVLGTACGFSLFLAGSGSYSLDHYFVKKNLNFTHRKWFRWMGSGSFPISNPKIFVLIGSVFLFGLTLYTNQYFHGGVWGTLHNKSVKPKIEISNAAVNNSKLTFEIYRTEGVDVYGSFLIGIHLLDEKGIVLKRIDGDDLSKFPKKNIHNHYAAKVKPGKHSLIIPLGAKADLTIDLNDILIQKNEILRVKLIDISGIEWTAVIE